MIQPKKSRSPHSFNTLDKKLVFIPERFNTNIKPVFFYYKITFINSQNEQIQKFIFTKNLFFIAGFKDFCYTNINLYQIWYCQFNLYEFKAKIPGIQQEFLTVYM